MSHHKKKFIKIMPSKSRNKTYVGYCRNATHKGYLTIELLHRHKCMQKNCIYFRANRSHPLFISDEDNRTYHTSKIGHNKLVVLKQYARDFAKRWENSSRNNKMNTDQFMYEDNNEAYEEFKEYELISGE